MNGKNNGKLLPSHSVYFKIRSYFNSKARSKTLPLQNKRCQDLRPRGQHLEEHGHRKGRKASLEEHSFLFWALPDVRGKRGTFSLLDCARFNIRTDRQSAQEQ